MDAFYVTLPSSSSMKLYPGNTLSLYKTELQSPIELPDYEYEAGLCEMHIHASSVHVQESDAIIKLVRKYPRTDTPKRNVDFSVLGKDVFDALFDRPHVYFTFSIRSGYYNSIKELTAEINKGLYECVEMRNTSFYIIDGESGAKKLAYKIDYPDIENRLENVKFTFSEQLMRILCLPSKVVRGMYFDPPKPVYNNLNVHIPRMAYIYSDVVEMQYVGDTKSRLLRIVRLDPDPSTGDVDFSLILDRIHYIPVSKNVISNIRIDIRSVEGYKYPFGFGTLNVKLHLRRRL